MDQKSSLQSLFFLELEYYMHDSIYFVAYNIFLENGNAKNWKAARHKMMACYLINKAGRWLSIVSCYHLLSICYPD